MRCPWCLEKLDLTYFATDTTIDIYCPRCDNAVNRSTRRKSFIGGLAIFSLCLYMLSVFAPLLDVYIFSHITVSFYNSVEFLFHSDIASAMLIFITIVLLPFVMILLVLFINYKNNLKLSTHTTNLLITIYYKIKPWHMIEVYFIGLLLAMIKLYQLSTVVLKSGFYLSILYIISIYILGLVFNPTRQTRRKYHKIDRNSLHKTVLYLGVALVFIYPAYSLPMMNFSKFGVLYATNLYEGIESFVNDGEMVVPMVMFVASFVIPTFKIVGLVCMVLMARYGWLKKYRKIFTKYYIISDMFGKYSLLDVFVVVLASSYIQYNNLVNIQPGEAFLPFILLVVFTMMASKSFDTRLLWYNRAG